MKYEEAVQFIADELVGLNDRSRAGTAAVVVYLHARDADNRLRDIKRALAHVVCSSCSTPLDYPMPGPGGCFVCPGLRKLVQDIP
jgi:hypothetical protein